MKIRLSAIGSLTLTMLFAIGCSRVPVPTLFASPTPPPTQVPLPTRIAIAVPTPTLANLVPPDSSSEAATMLHEFIRAVAIGDLEDAMSYWATNLPGQSSGYAANVRKMVHEWITLKRQFIVGEITYSGMDATGKYVTMPMDDPRVEKATARVRVDGIEYRFFLTQLKGGWFIEGVNTTGN